MNPITKECQKCQRLLRGYVLGTLGRFASNRVEKHIATCDACREALAAERGALGVLDRLTQAEPRRDLTAAVMERVRRTEEEIGIRRPVRRVPAFVLPVLIVVAFVGVVAAVLLPALRPMAFKHVKYEQPARTLAPSLGREVGDVKFAQKQIAPLGYVPAAEEASHRLTCENNLKQIGLIFKMYANENRGSYPPLAPYKGIWMVDLARLYPEFVQDLPVFICWDLPEHDELANKMRTLLSQSPIDWEEAARIAARSYTYTNWLIRQDSDVIDLTRGYVKLATASYDRDIMAADRTFHRLRQDAQRFLITDINNPASTAVLQADTPVMFDSSPRMTPRHRREGCNVLYLDGHVAFVEQGEKFPATKAVIDAFAPADPWNVFNPPSR